MDNDWTNLPSSSATPAEQPPHRCPLCERDFDRHAAGLLNGILVCSKCRRAFVLRRLAAYLIDDIFWWGVAISLSVGLEVIGDALYVPYPGDFVLFCYLIVFLPFLFTTKDAIVGYSFGKRIMGIRVLEWQSRRPIGFKLSIIRNLTLIFPFIPILAAFELPRGRRGGDLWADTFVVWEKYQHRKPFDPRGVLCTNCGYDLTGNVSGRCPECGKDIPRINDAARTTPPGIPSSHIA